MGEMPLLKKVLRRGIRILTGSKGVYCKKGRHNKVSKGTILYEPAEIGNHNYFAPYSLVYNAIIGNYCSIGPGCRIGLSEHDITAISTSSGINNGDGGMHLFDYRHPTVIEHDVWLGANVVVRQGVHIHTGAVVGANAVVTRDVPPYAVVVGIPAREIKKRFSDDMIDALLASEWFNQEPAEARRIADRIRQEHMEGTAYGQHE